MSPPKRTANRRKPPVIPAARSSDSSDASDDKSDMLLVAPPPKTGRGGKKSPAAAAATSPVSQSQRGNQSQSQRKKKTGPKENENSVSIDELVTQVVHYLLRIQSKKVPVKKSEILKNAMNHQSKDFAEVIGRVEKVLDDVFGYSLVAIKADDGGGFQVVPLSEGNTFMGVSRLDASIVECAGVGSVDSEKNGKRGLIRVIVNCIFMLGREIDEDYIWQIVTTLEYHKEVCPRREDLRKFLKSECVDPMYLNRHEIKNVDGSTFRYNWGVRAELELDKYEILKHVAKSLDKSPQSFRTQYYELMKTEQYQQRMTNEQEMDLLDATRNITFNGNDVESDEDLELEEIPDTLPNSQRKKNQDSSVDTETDSD